LWNRIAGSLIPESDDTFECQATVLLLAYAGTSGNSALPFGQIVTALTELGWRQSDGHPVPEWSLHRLPAYDVLKNVSTAPISRYDRRRISPAAATLARAALRREKVDAWPTT
jgi:hypothetical protein